jgi:hypothetical protein
MDDNLLDNFPVIFIKRDIFYVLDEIGITKTFMSLKTRQLKDRISSIVSLLLSFIPIYILNYHNAF